MLKISYIDSNLNFFQYFIGPWMFELTNFPELRLKAEFNNVQQVSKKFRKYQIKSDAKIL